MQPGNAVRRSGAALCGDGRRPRTMFIMSNLARQPARTQWQARSGARAGSRHGGTRRRCSPRQPRVAEASATRSRAAAAMEARAAAPCHAVGDAAAAARNTRQQLPLAPLLRARMRWRSATVPAARPRARCSPPLAPCATRARAAGGQRSAATAAAAQTRNMARNETQETTKQQRKRRITRTLAHKIVV